MKEAEYHRNIDKYQETIKCNKFSRDKSFAFDIQEEEKMEIYSIVS